MKLEDSLNSEKSLFFQTSKLSLALKEEAFFQMHLNYQKIILLLSFETIFFKAETVDFLSWMDVWIQIDPLHRPKLNNSSVQLYLK